MKQLEIWTRKKKTIMNQEEYEIFEIRIMSDIKVVMIEIKTYQ